MQPRLLVPDRVGRPWGGGRFGLVDGEPVGELWVTGDRATFEGGRSLVAAGVAGSVPLVKVLDVGGPLSVQVHPGDRLARELHGADAVGKHEVWFVLDADPEASFYAGLSDPSRVDDLFSGEQDRVLGALVAHRAVPGSLIDIAPGTVHSPGPGLLLYEVQQRSDLTYRIWDWGRVRPMHLEEGRLAIRPDAVARPVRSLSDAGVTRLTEIGLPFRVDLVRVDAGEIHLEIDRSTVLSPISGALTLDRRPIEIGRHWLLDAAEPTLAGSGQALLAAWADVDGRP